MVTEWLKKNKELCEKATKGQWIAGPQNGNYGHKVATSDGLFVVALSPAEKHEVGHNRTSANMDFIAASRLSLPQALRIIEALIEGVPQCLTENDARSIAEAILNERSEA